MYAKLALRNIKRSFSDYAVYFLTLSFTVALFYVFNALPESSGLSSTSASLRLVLQSTIRVLSVLIAVTVGFLIIYANNFLIKKRKKEIGTYLIMGMDQQKLGAILFFETLFLGAVALVIGLAGGVFLSQGFSFLVAKMFEQDLTLVHFSISWKTMSETTLYFLGAFFVVALLSSRKIARVKIIDLLQGAKKGEKTGFYKPALAVITFIAALGCLGTAYWLGLFHKNVMGSSMFYVVFVLGTVGTYLFYFSAANFLLLFFRKNKRLYYKNLNMFSFRQLTSKINTHTVMLGTISMMLFITICTMATGFGLNAFVRSQLDDIAPIDFQLWAEGDLDRQNLESYLTEKGYEDFTVTKTIGGASALTIGDIITEEDKKTGAEKNNYFSSFMDANIIVFPLSDFNAVLMAQGYEPIAFDENSFAIYSIQQNGDLASMQENFIANGNTITVNGQTLNAAKDGFIGKALMGTNVFAGYGTAVILPDSIAPTAITQPCTLFLLKFDKQITDTALNEQMIEDLRQYPGTDGMDFGTYSHLGEQQSLYGSAALGVFAGLYLGLMFLVISSTLLALHQLTDAAEHKPRYEILSKIGAAPDMLNKSIFKQILLYFFAPLFLTAINSIFALKVIAKFLLDAGNVNIWPVIGISVLIFSIFYAIYFIASYMGYKRILKTT